MGRTVVDVEARAKHLLLLFSGDLVLRSHLGMNGAWHLYGTGERWRRPGHQARVILTAGERTAVCFGSPRVELIRARALPAHPVLGRLGPDVVAGPVDVVEVLRRVRARPADTPVGDLLLDQQVVSGIGNIYRCESLFLTGVHPATSGSAAGPDRVAQIVTVASELMRANLSPRPVAREVEVSIGRPFGVAVARPWVYRRQGRPCPRCGALIHVDRMGQHARMVWFCPACQPRCHEG